MTEASRKHVACLRPPAMQLHALRSPIEELVGFARARIWPVSVGFLWFAADAIRHCEALFLESVNNTGFPAIW